MQMRLGIDFLIFQVYTLFIEVFYKIETDSLTMINVYSTDSTPNLGNSES